MSNATTKNQQQKAGENMESKSSLEEALIRRFFMLNDRAKNTRSFEIEISAVETMIKIYEALKEK